MKRLMSMVCGVLASVAVCASASAQVAISIPWKHLQPWTKPYASFPSLVLNCQGQQPTGVGGVCFDDWICGKTGPIVGIWWWGTVNNPNPFPTNFYIAFYTDNGCRPAQLIYQSCVQASNVLVGVDCQQRRVYRFSATFPAPVFSQVQGTHYWVQISEVAPGGAAVAVNFRWSAHRPQNYCPAVGRTPAGVFVQPLLDPCDNIEEDLAFGLFSKKLIGHLTPIPATAIGCLSCPPAPVYNLELRQADGTLVDSMCIMPDANGDFECYPEAPDGSYEVWIRGMSSKTRKLPAVQMGDGSVIPLGNIAMPSGDADSDDDIDFGDITRVLANYGL